MIARLPFTIGAAIMLAVMLSFALAAMRPARPPLIAKAAAPFADRWEPPLPASTPIVPKEVRTIPIVAAPPAPSTRNYRAPEIADPLPPHRYVAPEAPPKKKRESKREPRDRTDICRGKGKRYTDNKRSWRCRR